MAIGQEVEIENEEDQVAAANKKKPNMNASETHN